MSINPSKRPLGYAELTFGHYANYLLIRYNLRSNATYPNLHRRKFHSNEGKNDGTVKDHAKP